jgi:phosphoenolpyruvate synthase/pyruvate phosphate dikinase
MCGSYCRDQETIVLLDDWGLDSVCCHPSCLVKARLVAGQVSLARESRDLILSQEQIL